MASAGGQVRRYCLAVGVGLHAQMFCRAQRALHTLSRLLMALADRCCEMAVQVLVRPSTLLLLLPCLCRRWGQSESSKWGSLPATAGEK